MEDFKVCALIRCSKKSGKIDTTMTAMGSALLRLWALQNTTSSKMCVVLERDTGKILYMTCGTKEGFPKVKDIRHEDLGTIEDIGLPMEFLETLKDDRFDKED